MGADVYEYALWICKQRTKDTKGDKGKEGN